MMQDTPSDLVHDDAVDLFFTEMDEERLGRSEFMSKVESFYIPTGRDKLLSKELSNLIDALFRSLKTSRPQGGCLAVVGESGAGKSWAIENALDNIKGLDHSIVLRIEAPKPCSRKQLGRNILTALNYKLKGDPKDHLVWEKVRAQLKAAGKRVIWIDEMQHALVAKDEEQLEGLSETLKSVMQQRNWPVCIICSGTPELSTFLGFNRQLERRSRTIPFASLSFSADAGRIRNLVKLVIEKHAEMRTDDLLTDEFVNRLCVATESQFGSIIATTRVAVGNAYDREGLGACVSIKDYADAYKAERNCLTQENVFLAPNWHEVLPRNSRLRPSDPTTSPPSSSVKKGRR